jgi:hypothetical protein
MLLDNLEFLFPFFQEKHQLLIYADGVDVFDVIMDTGNKITGNYLLAAKCINRNKIIAEKRFNFFCRQKTAVHNHNIKFRNKFAQNFRGSNSWKPQRKIKIPCSIKFTAD